MIRKLDRNASCYTICIQCAEKVTTILSLKRYIYLNILHFFSKSWVTDANVFTTIIFIEITQEQLNSFCLFLFQRHISTMIILRKITNISPTSFLFGRFSLWKKIERLMLFFKNWTFWKCFAILFLKLLKVKHFYWLFPSHNKKRFSRLF